MNQDPERDPPTTSTYCGGYEAGHEWVVYSTALNEVWLMLQCVECGLLGTVEDPSPEEWSEAFHAPSSPYRWRDELRVVEKGYARYCVIRFIDGPACPCPSQSSLPRNTGYQRLPEGISEHNDAFSDEVTTELIELADFVDTSDLCSHLLPLFIRSCEAEAGVRHSEAVHRIITLIEQFDSRFLHCSPAVVAKIIRDYAEYQAQCESSEIR
jgi:hypothetical protein